MENTSTQSMSIPLLTFRDCIAIPLFYMLQRPKYNNMEPDVVDFFGECMTSPKNGRTPLANEIYVSYKGALHTPMYD